MQLSRWHFLNAAVDVRGREWADFLGLMSHLDKLEEMGGDTWQNLCLMAKGAKEYARSAIDEQTMREAVGKVIERTLAEIQYLSNSVIASRQLLYHCWPLL
jgi:hypothetical protein